MKENSIEEDIKILENMNDGYTFKDCDICNNYNEKTKHCDKHKCMELQAIEHILSDYKRVLKENNRLEEQVEYDKTHIYTPQTIELNFISKSKTEDKIKKLNDVSNAEELEDIMNRKNYTIVELVQYVLQELLEGRK